MECRVVDHGWLKAIQKIRRIVVAIELIMIINNEHPFKEHLQRYTMYIKVIIWVEAHLNQSWFLCGIALEIVNHWKKETPSPWRCDLITLIFVSKYGAAFNIENISKKQAVTE